MNATFTRVALAAIAAVALASGARAEYRCEPASTAIDKQACEAAGQGPEELRRFVQVTKWIRSDLHFADYVDRKTAAAWEMRARERAARDREEPARKQIAAETH